MPAPCRPRGRLAERRGALAAVCRARCWPQRCVLAAVRCYGGCGGVQPGRRAVLARPLSQTRRTRATRHRSRDPWRPCRRWWRRYSFVTGHRSSSALAELAARQHGVVATWQLSTLGLRPQRRSPGSRSSRPSASLPSRRLLRRPPRLIRRGPVDGGGARVRSGRGPQPSRTRPRSGSCGRRAGGPVDVTVPGRSRKGQRRDPRSTASARSTHDDRTVLDGIPRHLGRPQRCSTTPRSLAPGAPPRARGGRAAGADHGAPASRR